MVGFRHDLRDAVVRTTLPDRRFLRVNLHRLESTGFEMVASLPVGPVLLGADVTFQSVVSSDTSGVGHRPENLPELFGGVHATVRLPSALSLYGAVRYTGRQSCIDLATGGDAVLDDAAIMSAAVRRTWQVRDGLLGRVETTVAVDNLAGSARYDQCGLPGAGRLVRVGVRVF